VNSFNTSPTTTRVQTGKTTIIRVCKNKFKPGDDVNSVTPTLSEEITRFNSKDKKDVEFAAWDLSVSNIV